MLTGTTASNLTSAIVEGLKGGQSAAEVFANNFGKMMQDSAASYLERWLYDTYMMEYFKKLGSFLENDFIIDANEQAQLAEDYKAATEAAQAMWEYITANFPEMADAMSPNSLQGAIKGMSEETAGLLAGQFNALRINSAEHLNVAREALLYQAQTAANTRELIGLSATLSEIKSALKSTNDPLRGKGL
jgi:hypothetical protein